jgi:hypothetical protein
MRVTNFISEFVYLSKCNSITRILMEILNFISKHTQAQTTVCITDFGLIISNFFLIVNTCLSVFLASKLRSCLEGTILQTKINIENVTFAKSGHKGTSKRAPVLSFSVWSWFRDTHGIFHSFFSAFYRDGKWIWIET